MANNLFKGTVASAFIVGGIFLINTFDQTNDTQSEIFSSSDSEQVSESTKNATPSAVELEQNKLSQEENAISIVEGPFQLGAQVSQAMLSFTELSKYPPSSQPVLSKEHVKSFVNSVRPSAERPYPIEGLDETIQLSIRLEEFDYFYGDTIVGEFVVEDFPSGASISTQASVINDVGEELTKITLETISEESRVKKMRVSFDSIAHDISDWSIDLSVAVHTDVDGHSLFITAPFRINENTAALDSTGFSYVDEEFLRIPVNINVDVPGYYFVSGILYGRESGEPLVYLESEGNLDEGLSPLLLSAHIDALKKGGNEGPYELKNIRLERWSDEIIRDDVAGNVPNLSYPVAGYEFSDYLNRSYVDPLQEERLKLMQGLSSL